MPANLSAQDIYDKEFTVDARGYSAEEVDSYLDLIIDDYQNFETQTAKLSSALVSCDQKIKDLEEKNQSLEQEIQKLKEEAEGLQKANGELKSAATGLNSRIDELNAQLDEQKQAAKAAENKPLTLEERVARLEKAVFE